MEFDELSRRVIGCAIEVHRTLGPGLLESAHRQCLACELSPRADPVSNGDAAAGALQRGSADCAYRIDFLVSGDLIVEVKSVETLLPIH